MDSKSIVNEIKKTELRLSYADPKTARKLTQRIVKLKEMLAGIL